MRGECGFGERIGGSFRGDDGGEKIVGESPGKLDFSSTGKLFYWEFAARLDLTNIPYPILSFV
jgi:hypothetical protein